VATVYNLFNVLFAETFCNSAPSELKCKAGIKIHTKCWHFIVYRELVLSPFSSNISCFSPQSASVLNRIKKHSVT